LQERDHYTTPGTYLKRKRTLRDDVTTNDRWVMSRMGTKDLEVIIMVNPEEYQDIEVYENIKSTFPRFEEFYERYWKEGQFYEADKSNVKLHVLSLIPF
jgi:hypothetical protein